MHAKTTKPRGAVTIKQVAAAADVAVGTVSRAINVHEDVDGDLAAWAIARISSRNAFGAIEALKQRGREVPKDVSVIGFDYELERNRATHLTSICVDTVQVGRELRVQRSPGFATVEQVFRLRLFQPSW
jgi:DNA-binding LacI/PurR family transcriptional regulator